LNKLVAGGRFELYSAYPIRVPAVSASVVRTTWHPLQQAASGCTAPVWFVRSARQSTNRRRR